MPTSIAPIYYDRFKQEWLTPYIYLLALLALYVYKHNFVMTVIMSVVITIVLLMDGLVNLAAHEKYKEKYLLYAYSLLRIIFGVAVFVVCSRLLLVEKLQWSCYLTGLSLLLFVNSWPRWLKIGCYILSLTFNQLLI